MPFGPNPYGTLQVVGVLLILVGLVGVFLPILPGLLTIWLGALIWAIGDQFQRLSWPILLGMGGLVIVGWAANWLMTSYFTRRSSASWMTVAGAIVGGLIGSLLLGALPLIGSLVGAVIGGVAGVILVELLRAPDARCPARQPRLPDRLRTRPNGRAVLCAADDRALRLARYVVSDRRLRATHSTAITVIASRISLSSTICSTSSKGSIPTSRNSVSSGITS
jgi:uncharacterized protein YqgC (DUF456 family)